VGRSREELVVIVKKPGSRIVSRIPLRGFNRVVFVYNRQFTNAPNTTQIASGAGKSSAAGSNAAIGSKNTWQQESVGAGGKASNRGDLPRGRSSGKHSDGGIHGSTREKEAVIVVNDQVVKLAKGSRQSSATQVASGGGRHSAGGTNAAIESKGSRQQQAVGGGSGGVGANKLGGKSKKRKHAKKS
jgi:hypothetical protein